MDFDYYCFEKNKIGRPDDFEHLIYYYTFLGKILIYDSEKDLFLTYPSIKEVNISGKTIFPRSGVYQAINLINAIISKGGIPLTTLNEHATVSNWPLYYKPQRQVKILNGKELLSENNLENLIEISYDNKLFFKTKLKNFSTICDIQELFDETPLKKTIRKNEMQKFLISTPVPVVEDELGTREYRCIVINGRVQNISRITNELQHKIELAIIEKANEVVMYMNNKVEFPNNYVVDLFVISVDGKEIVDVLEFNPIVTSGLYLYNSLSISPLEDLQHNDTSNYSIELNEYLKIKPNYLNISTIGKTRCVNNSTRLFSMTFGFSAQLTLAQLLPNEEIPDNPKVHLYYSQKYNSSQDLFKNPNITLSKDKKI